MGFFGATSLPLLDAANTPLVRLALARARVIGSFALVQGCMQIISFASGILLIRYLDQREYAYFTIANSMQSTINILADIGISIGLVSIGGRVWHDRRRFGELITTALSMRRRLGAMGVVIITPLLCYMLVKNGASWKYTVILVLFVLAGLQIHFALGVLNVVPRLRSDTNRIQLIDVVGAVGRLVAIAVFLFLFLDAAVAVAISSAMSLVQYLLLRNYAYAVIDRNAPANAEDREAIRGFIRNQAPNAIFFCLGGQITVFLISVFGHRASSVAEIGALGRLAMVFAVLTNLLTNIFAPAFARCQSPRRLRWQYFGITGGVAAFSAVVIAAAAFFPHEFLFVLGKRYSHLDRELLLMVTGSVLIALAGTIWTLNAARAWVAWSWLYIPFTLAVQVAMIPWINFGNVRDVLIFNLVSAFPSLIINIALSYRGFRTLTPAAA